MSGNAQSMIYLSTSLFIFVGACWLSVSMSSQMDHALQAVSKVTRGQDRTINETYRSYGAELYSGSQVLYSLKESYTLGQRIEVDGISFSGPAMTAADQAVIDLQSNYLVKYLRDATGNIQSLIFTKAPKGTP